MSKPSDDPPLPWTLRLCIGLFGAAAVLSGVNLVLGIMPWWAYLAFALLFTQFAVGLTLRLQSVRVLAVVFLVATIVDVTVELLLQVVILGPSPVLGPDPILTPVLVSWAFPDRCPAPWGLLGVTVCAAAGLVSALLHPRTSDAFRSRDSVG